MTSLAPQPLLRLVREKIVGAARRIWISPSCSRRRPHVGVLSPSREFIEDINLIVPLNSVIYPRLFPWAPLLFWALRLSPPFYVGIPRLESLSPWYMVAFRRFEALGASRNRVLKAFKTPDESLWKCHVSVFRVWIAFVPVFCLVFERDEQLLGGTCLRECLTVVCMATLLWKANHVVLLSCANAVIWSMFTVWFVQCVYLQ